MFQSLVALLLAALLLLVVARHVKVPYPTLLALAGMGFATLPFVPEIAIDPHLALALFIAPALFHAAHETSPRALKKFWVPLVALAVVAVVLSTAAVATLGILWAGLPLAAAIALGAIVAPPDAAAAGAVLGEVGLPRRGMLVLQGESLLNDASALLIFGAALAMAQSQGGAATPLMLALAAPGGLVLGVAVGWLYLRMVHWFAGTLGASLVDFAMTFGLWLVADHLKLSPVLAVVAFGIFVAQVRPMEQPARDRLQTAAVWSAVVLVLNVVAFMVMGLQSRAVLLKLAPAERWPAVGFGLAVLGVVLVVRIAWVLGFRVIEGMIAAGGKPDWLPTPPPWKAAIIVSWSGMRGLLTLATAFALPASFPQRDLIVLAAFCVVAGTLILQGLTLGPLIRWLDLEPDDSLAEQVGKARQGLLEAGLAVIEGNSSQAADALRFRYNAAGKVIEHTDDPQGVSSFDKLNLRMICGQRDRLFEMRRAGEIAEDVYHRLQEELDWAEVDARSFSENVLKAT